MITRCQEVVSIVRADEDIASAVQKAIALAGGLPPVSGKHVVIKPNLMAPDLSGTGQITDVRVTEAVALAALNGGAKITIAEGAAVGFIGPTDHFDTLEAYEVAGYSSMARRLGIGLVDLNRDEYSEIPVDAHYGMPTVPVPKTLQEADLVISVPVFKTHPYSGLTLACKNFQGIMPWRLKRRTHRVGLECGVSDIMAAVQPGFAVVDGIMGRNVDGLVALKLIVAGRDCTAVDATCVRLVGYPPDRLALLRFNQERGLGVMDEDQIQVVGEPLEAVRRSWTWAPVAALRGFAEVSWVIPDPVPCSACAYAALVALNYIKAAYGLEVLKGLRIALGGNPLGELTEQVDLVIGDCARKWARGTSLVGGRAPSPAVVAAELCRLRGIGTDKLVQFRRRLPDSDWEDITPAVTCT